MEEKPLLQYYTDETWGYNCWDEKKKKQEGISVKFQQEEGETREDFFKRLGFEPKAKMYGSDLEKDWNCNNEYGDVREEIARKGYGLDVLVHDKDWIVRYEVAKQDYGLDILVHDEDWRVRASVARHGFGLDILVNDECEVVRAEVARQGFGLDILVHDKEWNVRKAVAEHGYSLDILVHDKDPLVRQAVAKQGFGLDILSDDEDRGVRQEAAHYLESNDYESFEHWMKENPSKVADKRNLKKLDQGKKIGKDNVGLDKIIDLLEEHDVRVSTCRTKKGEEIELSSFTNLGGEQIISFWCSDGNDPQEFAEEMIEFLSDFDPLEEAMLWVDERGYGVRGAPGTVIDLTRDQEEWREDMMRVAHKIGMIEL